jgi:hypothetical protein
MVKRQHPDYGIGIQFAGKEKAAMLPTGPE